MPASAVKGLEFDQVVLVEPADIADPALGPTGLRRLYTALTRAVLGLTIVHARPLPAALGAAPPPTAARARSAALVLVGKDDVDHEGDHADHHGAEQGGPEPVDLEGEVELVR